MVDLVKIRKKAKKVGESVSGRVGEEPVAEQPIAEERVAEERVVEEKPSAPPLADSPTHPLAHSEPPASSKLEKFKQEAGRRRELEAATRDTVEEAVPGTQLELLTFIIAGEHYAVDIERIVEIVTPRPLTRIPNADTSVVGIISLRGTIVTLVDVRRKLRHAAAGDNTPETRIVVIDFRGEMVGFVVDRVLRVVKIGAGDVEPHPVVHASEQDESVRGVFRVGGALTILIDLDKLLDSRALAATVG
jgi:purine-binding chemotaxis protein CheW